MLKPAGFAWACCSWRLKEMSSPNTKQWLTWLTRTWERVLRSHLIVVMLLTWCWHDHAAGVAGVNPAKHRTGWTLQGPLLLTEVPFRVRRRNGFANLIGFHVAFTQNKFSAALISDRMNWWANAKAQRGRFYVCVARTYQGCLISTISMCLMSFILLNRKVDMANLLQTNCMLPCFPSDVEIVVLGSLSISSASKHHI